MNKVEQKRKVQELMKSAGWGIIQQKMQEEILSAAYQMAENKMLTIDEINFRRGAMFAARRLMELPKNLDLLLEHELGHAFGYGHYDVKGHIMHSLYEQMGPMFW